MSRESIFTDKQLADGIINNYKNGLSCKEIAEKYFVSSQTIRKLLIKNEILLRKPKGTRSNFSNNDILTLYHNGETLEEIALKAGVKKRAIWNRLKKMGVNFPRGSSRKYQINKVFFNSWSYDMAYILGFIISDGCMSQNRQSVSISQNEKEILITIAKCLGLPEETVKKRENNYHLSFNSVEMCKMLYWHGIKPKKSLTIEFPKVPNRYLGAFLRGIIDGDGWVERNGYRVVVYTGSKSFSEGLSQAFLELQLNSKIRKDTRGLYSVTVSRKQNVSRLADIIYAKKGNLFLKRKYLRFNSAYQI